LFGLSAAAVARGLEQLNGSLTLLVESETGNRWTYKHPTISDAFASLIAESAELVELYVHGAKIERLLTEVVCGDSLLPGASVRVPKALYPNLLERIRLHPLKWEVQRFLSFRADVTFREMFFDS
jgi:hypothetical protein